MPAVPSCLLEPIWAEFHAAVGDDRPRFDLAHPLGCHRRRIGDRVVFAHLLDALVHGRGTSGSPRRRVRTARSAAGSRSGRRRMSRNGSTRSRCTPQLDSLPVDGCLTKAPCGGDKAGPSPVDRCKGGLKRSVATNGHDSPLLAPTLAAAAVQVGNRWVVERTHSWMNDYGKLRRCTDKDSHIVDFFLYLAAAIVTVRQLVQRARTRYRWDTRPTVRRLK